jgi:hypothetical protein
MDTDILWKLWCHHRGKLLHGLDVSWCTYNVDPATLQSTQWIINVVYHQRSSQSAPLFTAWFNHQIWGKYFFYCNHNIRGAGIKWKNRWRWLYDALIIHCVARIVAETNCIVHTVQYLLYTISMLWVLDPDNFWPDPDPTFLMSRTGSKLKNIFANFLLDFLKKMYDLQVIFLNYWTGKVEHGFLSMAIAPSVLVPT